MSDGLSFGSPPADFFLPDSWPEPSAFRIRRDTGDDGKMVLALDVQALVDAHADIETAVIEPMDDVDFGAITLHWPRDAEAVRAYLLQPAPQNDAGLRP